MSTNPKSPMTGDAAARIQSATTKQGGDTGKGTWPATAQSKAAETAKNSSADASGKNTGAGSGQSGQGQGQGQGGSGGGK